MSLHSHFIRKSRNLIGFLLILAPSLLQAQSPNVVFFLVDDLGPGEFKVYDNLDGLGTTSKIATPNIDALAQNGMRFNHAHSATAVCSPTRTMVNTGTTSIHTSWTWGWGSPFDKSLMTLPKMMKNAGYSTALIGKGHLGGDMFEVGQDYLARIKSFENLNNLDFDRPLYDGPQAIGYDYSLYLLRGIQDGPYFYWENGLAADVSADGVSTRITNANKHSQIREWSGEFDDGVTVIDGDDWGSINWNTRDVPLTMLNKSIDFVDDLLETSPSKPFFLQYYSVLGHSPYVPLETISIDINRDGDVQDEGEFYRVDGYDGSGARPDDLGTNSMRVVSATDAEVGVLMAYLSQTDDPRNPGSKLIDNTLFIFTSDNGGIGPEFISYIGNDEEAEWRDYQHDSTAGLSGNKTESDEGGHRIPYIVSWPSKIDAGVVREQHISTTDLMATLASLTGQNVIDFGQASFNMMPVFLGHQDDSDPVHDNLLVNDTGGSQDQNAKRNIYYEGPWKLILEKDNHTNPILFKVFNLDEDPGELNNLVNSGNPLIDKLYDNYLEEVNATRQSPVLIGSNGSVSINELVDYTDVVVEGEIRGGGVLYGDLQIYQSGVFDADDSAPTLTLVVGDITLRANSDLFLYIGDQSDKLESNHDLLLRGGGLSVSFYPNFLPQAGQVFDILDFSNLEGVFETVDLPNLPSGLLWNTADLYTNGTIAIQTVPTPSPTPLITAEPVATLTPTPTPIPTPAVVPTFLPTDQPTAPPTQNPTAAPIDFPLEQAVIEAEQAVLYGTASAYADNNASADQAIAYVNEPGSRMEFLNVPRSNTLSVAYASMLSGEISVSINDGATTKLSFTSTGNWVGNYELISMDINIPDSAKVTIFYEVGDMALNIDYIQLNATVALPEPTPSAQATPLATPSSTPNAAPAATPSVTPTASSVPLDPTPTPTASSAPLDPTPTPASIPVQVETIEAEVGVLNGTAAAFADANASGSQAIAYISELGASVEFFNVPQATSLTLAYASELSGSISVSVDEAAPVKFPFESTGTWVGQYSRAKIDIDIPASAKLTIFYVDGDTPVNIDFIELSASVATPTPLPTLVPTASPTAVPTVTPTLSPTVAPTPSPTLVPTAGPTAVPTVTPTLSPTVAPTALPTLAPTATPTIEPLPTPSVTPIPVVTPTSVPIPSITPTPAASAVPTAAPTPTLEPTPLPTPSWYFLVHKPTGYKIYSCEATVNQPIIARSSSFEGDCSQWRKVRNGQHFYLEHKFSRKLLKPDTIDNGSLISLQPETWLGSWTQWRLEEREDGFSHIINRATGKLMYLSNQSGSNDNHVIQQPASWRGDYTRWQFQRVP